MNAPSPARRLATPAQLIAEEWPLRPAAPRRRCPAGAARCWRGFGGHVRCIANWSRSMRGASRSC